MLLSFLSSKSIRTEKVEVEENFTQTIIVSCFTLLQIIKEIANKELKEVFVPDTNLKR